MSKKESLRKLFLLLSGWQVLIVALFALSTRTLSLQLNYLGGGVDTYLKNPVFWAHANYDGEHYIEIARFGYRPLQYFFFPIYPTLVKAFANQLPSSQESYVWSGIIVSLLSFIIGFIYFYKLLRLDYTNKFSLKVIVLILLFPTSFFFQSVYTESLFFAFCILSFYLMRSKKWLWASIFGGLAAATRIVGVVLFLALFVEWLRDYKAGKTNILTGLSLLLIPLGLFLYMGFLQKIAGDPFAFFHNISIYGDQRSSHIILLPQVIYRYIFKILPNVGGYLPTLATSYLEFVTGILFLILSLFSFKKLRLSYTIFLVAGYIIPTLTGSFSSLPRYVIVLFPGFILSVLYIEKLPKVVRIAVYLSSFLLLVIFTGMFVRGYWVS